MEYHFEEISHMKQEERTLQARRVYVVSAVEPQSVLSYPFSPRWSQGASMRFWETPI
jgi:hypothetical protein